MSSAIRRTLLQYSIIKVIATGYDKILAFCEDALFGERNHFRQKSEPKTILGE